MVALVLRDGEHVFLLPLHIFVNETVPTSSEPTKNGKINHNTKVCFLLKEFSLPCQCCHHTFLDFEVMKMPFLTLFK